MDFYLRGAGRRRGLARAIYEQVREAIAEGRLRAGDRLPPSRDLAEQLAVSRHTVTTAYGFLTAERFLEGATGAGTRVARGPIGTKGTGRPLRWAPPPRAPLSARSDAPVRHAAPPEATTIDATIGTPDAALFPYDDWRLQTGRELREFRPGGGLRYGDSAGDPALREAIAAWVHRSRGVRAEADRVVVTAGAQQAFDLIRGVLTRPGDLVALEDPGDIPFCDLALARGLKLAPVPAHRRPCSERSLASWPTA
jgi:GntR family transcriptional regulator / MocR family aminotransferase